MTLRNTETESIVEERLDVNDTKPQLFLVCWDDIKEAGQAAWDAITNLWSDLGDVIGGFADEMADRLISAFESAIDFITAALNRLIRLAKRAVAFAKDLFADGGPVPSGGSGFKAGGRVLADGGGPLRGPGTKTSDSILARLSRGEFVIRAAAVDRYGPGLFAALNSLKLPKGALPGFSMGGLIDGLTASMASLAPVPVPVYAAGGAVAASGQTGRPITIVLDGQQFNLTAEDAVAESLARTALGQERRRAGRLPGWFGG